MDDKPTDEQGNGPPRDPRDSLLVLARLTLDGAAAPAETVRVRNVSSGGLMAQAGPEFRVGARVKVELEGVGSVGGHVAWAEAGRIGVAFDHPIDKDRARKTGASSSSGSDAKLFRPLALPPKRPPLRKP